jgi:hypothetical protein
VSTFPIRGRDPRSLGPPHTASLLSSPRSATGELSVPQAYDGLWVPPVAGVVEVEALRYVHVDSRDLRALPVGAGNSSGHAEQAFRPTPSDPGDAARPRRARSNPENEGIAQAANTPKQFDPRVHPSDDRARCRARQRLDDSGGSRSSGDPSHHDRRSGKAAGQRPGRVLGTHKVDAACLQFDEEQHVVVP